ncbi:MAG: hypothetical protein AAF614_15725 [Chloroflexota bacterium]
MSEKRWLSLIITLYLMLGVVYAVTTPVFEASDELWHYPMIRHLADGNPLPIQGADRVGPWKQQASQPPLYYYVGAALTFWIDTSDMEQIRWLNPHVDNGVITEDGNINLTIHDPGWNQWQGTLLAVHLVRLFSVLLGATTVYFTYRIAKAVAPERPEIALGATAVNAFLPMFLFISGAVNNDNLVMSLVGLALVMMIYTVTSEQLSVNSDQSSGNGKLNSGNWLSMTAHWLLLGIVIGSAALAKFPGLALMFMALGTIFIYEWKQSTRLATLAELLRLLGRTLLQWLIVAIPFVLIAGWWYWRNKVLYGDWLGWSAFFEVLGVRATPASLAQLWDERFGFMMSYWGLFGGVNVPMPLWIYQVLNAVVIIAVPGFFVWLIREWRLEIRDWSMRNLQPLISNLLNLVVNKFALVVCLLWAAATVISLIRWTTITWSSQGRLVFAAVSTLSTLWMVGLVGWLPRRWATAVSATLSVFMFIIAALAPFLWIGPTYQPAQQQIAAGQLSDAVFNDQLRLVAYEVEQTAVRPNDPLWLHLEWEVLAPLERDWSLFIHLNDPVLGRPIAQRDMYPGRGLLATRLLEPGQTVTDSYRLQLPQTAVAPANLDVTIGLYDFHTFERLPMQDEQDALVLTQVDLQPIEGEAPNPISVNFEEELELVGYEVTPRRTVAGETVQLDLYWRAKRPLTTNYTFFAQLVSEDTTRWASQDLPDNTATWSPDAVEKVTFSLTLRDDTPPNLYPIILGAYTRTDDGGFDRLQRVTEDGRLTDDFFNLTPIRVD